MDIDDILDNDPLGLLGTPDDIGLFDCRQLKPTVSKKKADRIEKRVRIELTTADKHYFAEVQEQLANGVRQVLKFDASTPIQKGTLFVDSGVLGVVKNITMDGRTELLFENSTGSKILLSSLKRALYKRGGIVFLLARKRKFLGEE